MSLLLRYRMNELVLGELESDEELVSLVLVPAGASSLEEFGEMTKMAGSLLGTGTSACLFPSVSSDMLLGFEAKERDEVLATDEAMDVEEAATLSSFFLAATMS